ncbi:DMT family transporter [Benzoatithermus flavus]|uniref:DMT family transporter n=1 Tax=Benzoatithermus flavus TaxID=3108223 RepID=A0ABU8XNP5_9PROT
MREALPAARPGSSELRGIAVTLVAMMLFSLMDAVSKYLSMRYPTPQILWLRYLFTVPLVLVALAPGGIVHRVRSAHPWLQLLRSLLLVVEIGFVIWAFGRLPLADVQSVLALTPLAVTALSVPLLGEQVGARRWAAVAMGLVGILIVLRPGLGVIQPATLAALAAVLLYALYQILTRLVGRVDAAETSLLWQFVLGSIALTAVAPFFWRTPEPVHWPLFVVAAVLGGSGHYAMIKALQLAPAVVVQPFSYTGLLWSVIIGYLVFGDLPDAPTLIGAGVIVAAGTYAAVREHRLRRSF